MLHGNSICRSLLLWFYTVILTVISVYSVFVIMCMHCTVLEANAGKSVGEVKFCMIMTVLMKEFKCVFIM